MDPAGGALARHSGLERACAFPVDLAALRGRRCFADLDLSSTTDLTALVLYFPRDDDAPSEVLPYFWMPGENILQRMRRDRLPFDTWARDGYLELTEGNIVDYDAIRERVHEVVELYDLAEIAFDRWNATALITQFQNDGLTVVPFGQGFASMSAPTKELEKLILGRQLDHAGHPVLRWNVSNAMVRQDPAGNYKPDRAKSRDRIDGVVALAMALGRAIAQAAPQRSVYETREVLVV